MKLAEEKLKITARDAESYQKSNEEATRTKIELGQKVAILSTRNSDLTSKVSALNERCEVLSNEKIEILQNLDRKNQDIKDLRAELDEARKQIVDSKKSLVELSNDAQLARSSANSSAIRQQNLEQEIELLKNNNEWLDNELKSKTEEYRKSRSERLARITSLESQLETLRSEYQVLKSSSDSSSERLTVVSQKYDDTLVKVKDLQNSKISLEEGFRNEIEAQRRLSELWEKSAKDAKNRIAELEEALSNEKRRDGGDSAKWRNEAEKYRLKADKLKKRLEILEEELSSAHSDNNTSSVPSAPFTPGAGPTTPLRKILDSSSVIYSPSARIISEIQKNGGSLTQLYADFQETKVRLERERHMNETLKAEMAQILEDMEAHAPEILAESEENQRLEFELSEMSIKLEQATSGYEKVQAQYKQSQLKLRDNEKERILMSQQVTDLSRQVQTLLVQNQLISDSDSSPLNPEEYSELQKMLSGQDVLLSDTQQVISQRMILFKDIIELQKQNEQLVKIIRELGQKMEEEEAKAKSNMQNIESSAIEDAKKLIVDLQSELQVKTQFSEQIKHERDMFRDLLKKKGGETENGNKSSGNDPYVQQLLKQTEDATDRLNSVQKQFDDHKAESSNIIKKLNEQVNELSGTRADLHIQLSRCHSQVELTNERFKNLNETLEMVRNENRKLKQRSQELQDNGMKQDMKTQKVAEELIEARSKIQSIDNEAANLKAERSLWKSIEERLTKENSDLLEEKGRLNGLLTNFQMMETERESRDAETQKQLLSQIDALNTQINNLQERLEQEQGEVRRVSEKRDIDLMSSQSRIDKLNESLNQAKEELIKNKTEASTLEHRVLELTDLLKSSEERLALYKDVEEGHTGDSSLESKLRHEITSLTASLKLAEKELAMARDHNKELSEIASASEEGLKKFSESNDEFRSVIEKQLGEKEAELQKLANELEVTKTELNTKSAELAAGNSSDTERLTALENENVSLKGKLSGLEENARRLTELEKQLRNDVERQQEICRSAQENYEQEVVKLGQTTDQLQQVRTENVKLREQLIESTSKTKEANETLSSAEASWESQRYTYEHEIEHLKSRSDETASQNKLLLDQLERLTSNSSLADSISAVADGVTPINNDEPLAPLSQESSSEYLRGIIAYLKREKEVTEEKYEVSALELKRVKQRLDHTSRNLDEVKLALEKEREKTSGDVSKSEEEHQKLLNELADLNVLRESNSSLRSQSQYYSKKCEDLEKQVLDLQKTVEPLEEQLRQSVAELEAKDTELELMQKDNQHWKDRTKSILQRQEQADPEEMKQTKKALEEAQSIIEQLKSDKEAELAKSKSELDSQIEELNKTKNDLKTIEDRFQRLKQESIDKLAKRRNENAALKQQLEAAKQEAVKSQQSLNEASKNEDTDKLRGEHQVALKEKDDRILQLEEDVNRLSDEAVDLQTALKAAQEGAPVPEGGVSVVDVGDLEKAQSANSELQAQIVKLKKEVMEAKVAQAANASTEPASSEDSAVVASLTKENSDLKSNITQLEESIKGLEAQIEQLKASQTEKAPENESEFESKIASLKAEHEETVSKLNAQRDAWKSKMREKFEETLKKQRDNDSKSYVAKIEELQKTISDMQEKHKVELEQAKQSSGSSNGSGPDLTELEAKHKKELEAAVERARDMAKRESSMRMTLLQKKADKAEQQLKALKAGSSDAAAPAATTTPGSAPAATKPPAIANRVGGANAKPQANANRPAAKPAGSKLPLPQKNLVNRPEGSFKGVSKAGQAGSKRPKPDESQQPEGSNKKPKGGST